jgi:hypothetical protein
MKKTCLITLLAGILAILVPVVATQAFSGVGSGTQENPYIITNVQQLQEMNNDLDAWYELGNNIDASDTKNWNGGAGFLPVGNDVNTFTGHFDGKGHTITGLYINRPTTDYVGLFGYVGYVGSGGQIRNLGVENVNITGRYCVGGLVGYNYYGTLTACYATGSVSGTGSSVGGLVGSNLGMITDCYAKCAVYSSYGEVGGLVGGNGSYSYNIQGTVTDCYATGNVTAGNGSWAVGGLVGWDENGAISNCYSTGSVSGGDWGSVGGLVGEKWYGTIINCYSSGSVSGTDYVGGLVGWNYHYGGAISNCYSSGSVSGTDYVGGLVGCNYTGSISNCYANGSVNGISSVGGLVGYNCEGSIIGSFWDTQTSGQTTSDGGTGKTTAEMKQKATFTNWDFDTIWDIVEGVSYPWLRVFGGEKTLPEKAAELAKQVIGAPYLGDGETWGGKGYDYCSRQFIEPDKVKITGYCYWNNNTCVKKVTNECHSCAGGNCELGTDGAIGLDCSGLIYWSYNRAYFQSNQPGSAPRPFVYEGVSGQYSNYYINAPVSESDLHAGDLLFTEGHVMMYTGPFAYEGKTYNVVHASYCRKQVVPATYDFATKKVITEGCPDINITGYGRWRKQTVDAMYTKCPIDLVVTDPDGFTVSKDTPEIPGLLYFSVYDIDENGRPDEMVTIPKRKVGIYLITVIPESNALPTDTYSLEAIISGQTMILAQNVQIQNIPPHPYVFVSRLNPSDFDGSGHVDWVDLAKLGLYWLTEDCNYPDWCERTDLNYSGSVDFLDFGLFAQNWLWKKIPADLDIDGDVDFTDYAIFANKWMNDCVSPDWCYGCDFNKSGSVGIEDLAEFASHWLETAAP